MDPTNYPVHRRRILQSLGAAGSMYGVPRGLTRSPGVSSSTSSVLSDDVEWDAAEATIADFAQGFVDIANQDVVAAINDWIDTAFASLESLYDTVTDLLADSYQDFQALTDLDNLVHHGQNLLSELESARDWQNSQEDSDDEGGGNGGNSTTSSFLGEQAANANSADEAWNSTSAGAWPDVPDPGNLVSTFEELSEEAIDRINAAVDDVEAFIDRIKEGITDAIINPIVDVLVDVLMAPVNQIESTLEDLAESDSTDPIALDFDFPGLDYELPFSVDSPFVSPAKGEGDRSAAPSTAPLSSPGIPGVGSPTAAASSSQPRDFSSYLERAYQEVGGYVSSRTPLSFSDDRNCRGARGPIYSLGLNVDIPNNIGPLTTSFTLWFGAEPGRPCTYTGVDPDVTTSVSVQDVIDQVKQNQAEAYAVASYVRDKINDHTGQLEDLVADASEEIDSEPTFREVHSMATDLAEDFSDLESEITADVDVDLDVSAVLEDVDAVDVPDVADEMRAEIEAAASDLESSPVVADLLAIWEARADIDAPNPPRIEEIGALAGDLLSSGSGVTSAAFELPDLIDQASSDIAAWIEDLDSSQLEQVERQTGVDLDQLQDRLIAPDSSVFLIADRVRELVEDVVLWKFEQVKQKLESYLTVEHEFTEGWDEWLCAGLCYNPLLVTPVPVAVYWVAEEIWEITLDVVDDIIPDIALPGPLPDIDSPIAKVIMVVVVALIVIVIAVLFGSAIIGALTTIGAGITAFIASILSGIGGTSVALMMIVVPIIMTGHGDAIVEMLSDAVSGEQPTLEQA